MRCIHVSIKKIEVEKFSIREGASLKIFFDDGGMKCLPYSTTLDNVNEDVKTIFTKIQVYEKAQNRALDSEDILDNFVSVVIENDEEMMEKVKNFLARIRDDRSKLRGYGTHVGYIESLNKMQKKIIEFKDTSLRDSPVQVKNVRLKEY
jgi:hypothetical protein